MVSSFAGMFNSIQCRVPKRYMSVIVMTNLMYSATYTCDMHVCCEDRVRICLQIIPQAVSVFSLSACWGHLYVYCCGQESNMPCLCWVTCCSGFLTGSLLHSPIIAVYLLYIYFTSLCFTFSCNITCGWLSLQTCTRYVVQIDSKMIVMQWWRNYNDIHIANQYTHIQLISSLVHHLRSSTQ